MNALKLTQSAIAQEALLAGEPILHRLSDNMAGILSVKPCEEVNLKNAPQTDDIHFLCSIRENLLLMKNLVMYSLVYEAKTQTDFYSNYKDAYYANDLKTIAKLFNIKMAPERLEIMKNKKGDYDIVIKVFGRKNVSKVVRLPTPEELRQGNIIYSENMPRLLKMQEVILNGLEKVAPIDRDFKDQGLLKLLLLGA